jgi:DNA-binding response OmpR family regulator
MKKNILIIDHNSDTIDTIKEYLHNDVFDLTVAGDAVVARVLLSKKKFDLVIAAELLPKSHGNTLAKMVSEEFSDTKIMIISSGGGDQQRFEALQSGACDYIQKPLEESSFRMKVVNQLGLDQSEIFGVQPGDSTNLMVLPMLDEIRKRTAAKENGKEDEFDDIIKDVESDPDSFEINFE